MGHDDFDDGLVHGHDWAAEAVGREELRLVADASEVNTPSCVFHDDMHHQD